MCGINGIVGLTDEVLSEKQVSQMNDCMSHRGPDDFGVFTDKNVALGHRRLSIIDLSRDGRQPMISRSGNLIISFNGEIYNYNLLKSELGGYPFESKTDTEVILAAYEKWGEKCLEKFNGMFAFAIWDIENQTLFAARDRLGIKPMYYFQSEKELVFSSEIRCLLKTEMVPKKLATEHLSEFLEYQTVHAPNTLVKGVKMLEAGSWLKWKDGKCEIEKYWEAEKFIGQRDIGFEEAKKGVKDLFFQAVDRRLMADVPLGAFLSGGIDSSAVVAAMKVVSEEKINTFNVSFAEKEFSEAKYAEQIAKIYDTDHHEINLRPEDFLNQLPSALAAMDHPSGDGPNSYVVCEATKKKGITVALSGLGGDELFCGYSVFPLLHKLEKSAIKNLPLGFRKFMGNVLFGLKKGNNTFKIKQLLELEKVSLDKAYPIFRQTLWKQEVEKVVDNYSNGILEGFVPQDMGVDNIYSRISVAEMSTYMQNTLLRDTDQMSMAHSLEVRVPFLDHELVEFALSCGDSVKHPFTPKRLFTEAIGDLLPSEIVKRKKMGFTLPWAVWMKNELRDYCEEGLQFLQSFDAVNAEAVQELWHKFLDGRKMYTWTRVWPLVVLGHWMKNNGIEG
jgi:asparagine synthase (glutamine-hydrolysing)